MFVWVYYFFEVFLSFFIVIESIDDDIDNEQTIEGFRLYFIVVVFIVFAANCL